MALFEEILFTPDSGQFINLCLEGGASFYQLNAEGFYPIHYAIKSFSANNVKVLLNASNRSKSEIKFSQVINTKLYGRNNYLHLLLSELSNEKFQQISEVIKVLVLHGCCPNLLNAQGETPFSQLLLTPFDILRKKDLVEFFLQNSYVNFKLCKSFKSLDSFSLEYYEKKIEANDVWNFDYMLQQLNDENEKEFLDNFESFKSHSSAFMADLSSFLEVAIAKNLHQTVKLLIKEGVDINLIPLNSRFNMEPAFLAGRVGHMEIFTDLLSQRNLRLESTARRKNLLHEILSSHEVDQERVAELFTSIIMDQRCSLELINTEDKDKKSALYYACHNGYDDIARDLLKRGAYVGSSPVVDCIKLNILESVLDECLTMKNAKNDDGRICIDYQLLLPPSTKKTMKPVSKVEALKNISQNEKLNSLLIHPVVSSFLDLKYNSMKSTIFAISILHFLSLAYIVWMMSFFLKDAANYSDEFQVLTVMLFVFIYLSLILLEIYEIVSSFRNYFFKLGNWLDLLMIGTIIYAVIGGNKSSKDMFLADLQRAGAFLILFVSGQCIKIVGASIYTTIFRKVCSTFFKLMVMYSFLFITFALSFHILFNAEVKHEHNHGNPVEEQLNLLLNKNGSDSHEHSREHMETDTALIVDMYSTFGSVKIALFRVMTMFAGDLNSNQFEDPFKMSLLLLFIFFITITLQNLMNSMAIIDTQQIISEAEIIGLKKRVMMVYKNEKFFTLILHECFSIFSKDKWNKYMIVPSEGRAMTLYDPLISNHDDSVISQKKRSRTLIMSKAALESLTKYLETQVNVQAEVKSVCPRCSINKSEISLSDTKL